MVVEMLKIKNYFILCSLMKASLPSQTDIVSLYHQTDRVRDCGKHVELNSTQMKKKMAPIFSTHYVLEQ